MPHSTKDARGSSTTYSRALPGFINSQHLLPVPVNKTSAQQANSTKHASLPGLLDDPDLFSEPRADDIQQSQLGERKSMLANYSNGSRQRSQFYEDQFQYKENSNSSVRERVSRDSPVIAELRTNVIIKDEFTLVTDLTYHLAARYSRPDSAVMLKVDHSACLALGGTFEPCYLLTVTTVPSQMGPTLNKRNATLIQSFMADILSVPPERGILTFTSIPEESLAFNGTTMLGEIERQEKQLPVENGNAVQRVISSGRKSIPSFKKATTKTDAEAKAGDSKIAEMQDIGQAKIVVSKASLHDIQERRKSIAGPLSLPLTALSSGDIFELSAGEPEKKRPSTAHSNSTFSGFNGLRMNGVSNALDPALISPKSPNGRPQTFAGASSVSMDQLQTEAISDAAPPPPPVRLASPPLSKRDRPPSFLRTDPSKQSSKTLSRPSSTTKRTSLAPVDDSKSSLRNSYIDSLIGSPTAWNEPPRPLSTNSPTIAEHPEQPPLGKGTDVMDEKEERTANTAKRRSTISATALPKLEPPPIPKTVAKSNKSLKVGKRKSFLSAFRRS